MNYTVIGIFVAIAACIADPPEPNSTREEFCTSYAFQRCDAMDRCTDDLCPLEERQDFLDGCRKNFPFQPIYVDWSLDEDCGEALVVLSCEDLEEQNYWPYQCTPYDWP